MMDTYHGKTLSEWIVDLKNPKPAIHSKACDALGDVGKPAVPALIEALTDKAGLVRALAASILMGMGPNAEAAVPTLIETLQDRDVVVRLRAAQALVKITPNIEVAIPTLIDSLKVKVEFARADAAVILGDLGAEAKSALPALNEAWRTQANPSVNPQPKPSRRFRGSHEAKTGHDVPARRSK